jgi:citrate synthase
MSEKKAQLELKNTKTGQTWKLPAPGNGSSFVVVPTNPQSNTLTVLDNRTGKTYTIEIEEGTVNALQFKQIQLHNDPEGLRLYDPAFQNTAVAKSKITYIDGEQGILHYRGYPIEELAEKSNFLEVSYLLIYGELPDRRQYDLWCQEVMRHTIVNVRMTELMKTFNYDAHPMGIFIR